MKNRVKVLYVLLVFLAAEAIQITVAGVLSIGYGILLVLGLIKDKQSLSGPTEIADAIQNAMSQDIVYLISVIGVAVCGIVFFFWYRHEIRGEVRGSRKKVITVKNVILLLFLGMGCQFFISGIMSLIQKYFSKLFADYAIQMKQLSGGNIFVVLLLIVFIAPITEELVFRGVILHKANRYISFIGANLIQAVLFGIYHFNIIQGIYATLIGLLLGAVYYKFKSIFASIFLHMVINASSFLIMLFPDQPLWYLVLCLTGGVLLAVTIVLLKPSDTLVPKEINYNLPLQQPNQNNSESNPWNGL